VTPTEILDRSNEILRSTEKIAVSGVSSRVQTATMSCKVKEGQIVFPIPVHWKKEDSAKRLRLSFCAGPDNQGREVRGHGIARFAGNSGSPEVSLVPYRYLLLDPAVAAGEAVIEMRQNAWQLRPAAAPGPNTHGIRFWLRAARVVSIPLSFFPIAIGGALAALQGPLHWPIFLLALIGGVAAHLGTNLISDYFDYVKGVDTTNALSSHTGVLADELISPDRILLAAMACFLCTVFTGGFLVARVGWPVLVFGLAGVIGGLSYTGSPFASKYAGLGEVWTGLLMGPLMFLGSYFVQAKEISPAPVLLSVAIGLLVAGVSLANNMRDVFFDSQAGVATLAARRGARDTLFIFWLMLFLPYLLLVPVVLGDPRLFPVLLTVITLPGAFLIARRMGGRNQPFSSLSARAAEQVLPLQMIKLHTRFCLLLFIGDLIAAGR